jgi:hypothetical protein
MAGSKVEQWQTSAAQLQYFQGRTMPTQTDIATAEADFPILVLKPLANSHDFALYE